MAYISKITLPTGGTYDIKDAEARQSIEDLQSIASGAMHYAGITTTTISDGSTTKTLTIDGESKTFTENDTGAVVIYQEQEFVWNGSKWQEFGSTGSLKALAFKDSASTSYTPAGSVTQPSFTGTAATISVKGTPSGSVSITKGTGTANYTPEGSVSKPTVTVNNTTATVNSITDVGSLPTCTLPTFGTAVYNENLTLSWSSGSFDGGSLPTKGTDTTVVSNISGTTVSSINFTGTGVELKGSFSGSELTSTASFTPAGTVSKPTFSGTQATITVN